MNRWVLVLALMPAVTGFCMGEDEWLVYEGQEGAGRGKHVVLVSGDEEYRSEEALPLLARILSTHHGFKCTVLFAIDPATGIVDPNNQNHIPGLDALNSADLMILFTRFRDLAGEQMQHIDTYLRSGRPVIGIRTSTHAFLIENEGPWAHYGNGYDGDKMAWKDGFGRLVMGEKWINHHGRHRHQSTRGVIASGAENHPILRGLKDTDMWGPSDVYGVRLPLPDDAQPLVLGQVINRRGTFDPEDPLYGMRPSDDEAAGVDPERQEKGNPNDPMMPIAWTKTYRLPGGKAGTCFSSTLGASTDLLSEGTRRLLINAVYWSAGLADRIPAGGTNAAIVGKFEPTAYEMKKGDYWLQRGLRVSDLR